MGFYFSSWWADLYFAVFLVFLTYYIHFKLVASKYWKNRNVKSVEPVFLLGNLWKANVLENFESVLGDYYREWKNEKLVGLWNFLTPVVLLTDLNVIKNVLVRDFEHFQDHGFEVNFEREPLSGHLFNLTGTKWRNMRVKLTPTFTSGKMKMMFPIMQECGEELQKYLKGLAEEKREVEVKEILARFTTDVISSCAFGIQTNSMKNPNAEFRQYGKKLFEPSWSFFFVNLMLTLSPKLYDMLKLRFIAGDASDFFLKAVKDTMDYRERNQVMRKDFMELLIQLKKKGRLEDVDGIVPATAPGDDEPPNSDMIFTLNDAAAQAFVFFFAGFETSSITLTFALYELAMNTDVRIKLQEEMDRVLAKENGNVTYEGVMQMEYLDWVVQETLRKYPPATPLFRKCTKDYYIPELNVKIEKKCPVFIPIMSIHRDPEIYPNPDKFDPLRFSPEEKAKRDHFAYLPFGEGPRVCIGSRFGILQTKIGLVSILSKYNVHVSSRTPSPLKFEPRLFILATEGGMHLKFSIRNA